jgi:hypothetical protein
MMASEPTLSSLAHLTESASAVLPDSTSAAANETKEQQRRHYIRTLLKVVDEAAILLVLDARDPAGCRSRLVEEEVRRREAEGKRLVFVQPDNTFFFIKWIYEIDLNNLVFHIDSQRLNPYFAWSTCHQTTYS